MIIHNIHRAFVKSSVPKGGGGEELLKFRFGNSNYGKSRNKSTYIFK